MLYRNLLAMDTKEMIRAQPLDGVVLLASCDKNIPAQLMGAASAGRPAILLTGGPMLTSRWNGQTLGACTDCRRLTEDLRAGRHQLPAVRRDRGRAGPHDRPLHGHGDCLDDGGPGRGPGHGSAGDRSHPGPGRAPACGWRRGSAGRSWRFVTM